MGPNYPARIRNKNIKEAYSFPYGFFKKQRMQDLHTYTRVNMCDVEDVSSSTFIINWFKRLLTGLSMFWQTLGNPEAPVTKLCFVFLEQWRLRQLRSEFTPNLRALKLFLKTNLSRSIWIKIITSRTWSYLI